MAAKGIIYVDSKKCLGCKRCYQACGVTHSSCNSFFELAMAGGEFNSSVQFRPIGKMVVPIQCRHCEGAACIAACPSGALEKLQDGGYVILNESRCVGCQSCKVACPYGAIRTSVSSGKIYKCDFCILQTSAGKSPACVEACPTGCLSYQALEQVNMELNLSSGIIDLVVSGKTTTPIIN